MSYPVKIYKWNDTGAPQLSGQVGALIGVLDAFINGYNAKTVTITRSDTTATVTDTGHGRNTGDIVLISGAIEIQYNGEYKITVTGANTYTYQVSGSPATPATGTITAKMAPHAVWTRPYTGVNKAAYRSTAAGGTGLYLRIDDTNAQYALVRGYETMTDVDTGTGLFPTAAQLAGGMYWRKSDVSSSAARPWAMIVEDQMIYLFIAWANASPALPEGNAFGDVLSFKSGDAYHCIIIGSNSLPGNIGGTSAFAVKQGGYQVGQYLARSYNQIGAAITATKTGDYGSGAVMGGSGASTPNVVDNAIHLRYPINIWEGANTVGAPLRGVMPGIYDLLNSNPYNWGDTLADVANYPGRAFFVQKLAGGGNGTCAVDITGPWR